MFLSTDVFQASNGQWHYLIRNAANGIVSSGIRNTDYEAHAAAYAIVHRLRKAARS